MADSALEHWMRGPVEGITPLLQPVAHALLQMRDEVQMCLVDFPAGQLWTKPDGLASVGFHVQHICGVIDRLLTYARDESLSESQLMQLEQEARPSDLDLTVLLQLLDQQVASALEQLTSTSAEDLLLPRGIGRKKIPTNVLGLLFHAAEHSMRHLGQLRVTAKWVRGL